MSIVYKITGSIGVAGLVRPQSAIVSEGHIRGTYVRQGGKVEYICTADWKDAPHVALANLTTSDKQGNRTMNPDFELRIGENELKRFTRTYGVLNGGRKSREFAYRSGQIREAGSFDQEIVEIVDLQYYLRLAWTGKNELSSNPILHLEGTAMNDAFSVFFVGPPVPSVGDLKYALWEPSQYKYEKVVLATDDLSKLICYSFLRDFSAGKTGFCGNPDCPAPYFLKRRVDQKYCGTSCSEYAQRQYSLNWWRKNRQGKRAKQRRTSPRKKKK